MLNAFAGMKNLLLVALVAGGLWYYTQSQEFIKKYKVSISKSDFNSAKSLSAGYEKLYFTITAKLSNATDFAGTLKSGYLNVFYNSKFIGKMLFPTAIKVEANKVTEVKIPVVIDSIKIFSSVLEAAKAFANNVSISVKLQGKLDFAVGQVTVNQDYKLI